MDSESKPVTLYQGDCVEVLKTLPSQSVHCCVTSPPYFGLRDYGVEGQIGLEESPQKYVERMVEVFAEVKRVLRDDGTLWLNLGDSYANDTKSSGAKSGPKLQGAADQPCPQRPWRQDDGVKKKDLLGIPWRVAFALQADGWYLRQDVIWHKPNPMPESVRDRCTKAHEYLFLLSKSPRYYFNADAIKEPATYAGQSRGGSTNRYEQNAAGMDCKVYDTRNKRSVWTVKPALFKGAHFATMPPDLVRPCVLAGCPAAGKRCDCDEVIGTPTGEGEIIDPSMETGRAGMNRPRRDGEGTRPITRREQRHEAKEMKASPHRGEMEAACGSAFAHYIRTDRSGARPLPERLRQSFRSRGWLTESSPCRCSVERAGVVLDPFAGAGTTALVAVEEGRRSVGVELNPAYCEIAADRVGRERVEWIASSPSGISR